MLPSRHTARPVVHVCHQEVVPAPVLLSFACRQDSGGPATSNVVTLVRIK